MRAQTICQISGSNGNGTNLSSATASTYTKTNAQLTDTGSYSVLVTNVAGSVTSSNAVLTVLAPPSIQTQPLSQAVLLGSNAAFTVKVLEL
jgi:hypothetical protein